MVESSVSWKLFRMRQALVFTYEINDNPFTLDCGSEKTRKANRRSSNSGLASKRAAYLEPGPSAGKATLVPWTNPSEILPKLSRVHLGNQPSCTQSCIGVGGRGEACKPGSAKDQKAHLYTLPFMQENLQTGCKAIEEATKQAGRQQNPIGNRIGN